MGVSLSVSQGCQRFISPTNLAAAGFLSLACQVLLLLGWSWSGGFVVGSLSGKTLWIRYGPGREKFRLLYWATTVTETGMVCGGMQEFASQA